VLREIAGKPLVVHVWEAAKRSPALADVLVATDWHEVVAAWAGFGVPAVLTSAQHPSGTDRVWEVAQSRAADVYVNVQGDEPLVTPGHIERLVGPFREHPDTQVSTLKIRLRPDEVENPGVNKVVCAADGRALYFSKYPVPYDRDGRGVERFKHIGLYAYRAGPVARSLFAGRLADRWGTAKTLVLGQALIAVGLVAASAAGSYATLITLMVVAGVGYGTLNPASTTAAMSWFPPRQRATVVGLKQVGLPFGGMLGAAILPAVALALGWRLAVAAAALPIMICAV